MNFIFNPSLVLYLPLHQLDGVSFISKEAYGHLCTVTGAPWGIQGRTFDGIDNTIAIPDAPSLSLPGSFTLMWWAKKTAVAANQAVFTKDAGGAAGTREWGAWYNAGDNLYLEVFIAGTGDASTFTSSTVLPINSFHHAVFTYDNVNMRIYANGVLDNTPTAWTGPLYDTTTALAIGTRSTGGSPFTGVIGEVLIYNRALSASEIQRIYLATKWRYS